MFQVVSFQRLYMFLIPGPSVSSSQVRSKQSPLHEDVWGSGSIVPCIRKSTLGGHEWSASRHGRGEAPPASIGWPEPVWTQHRRRNFPCRESHPRFLSCLPPRTYSLYQKAILIKFKKKKNGDGGGNGMRVRTVTTCGTKKCWHSPWASQHLGLTDVE
jgi:hypothetical protein